MMSEKDYIHALEIGIVRKCSYTWNELGREMKCPEEIWPGSEEYCIFHDPFQEKDTKLFMQKLERKLKKEDYNLRGYCFPEEVSFRNRKFGENVVFNGATFQNVVFNGATFQNVVFNGATFQNVVFNGATFQKNANFIGATFQKNANFIGATFQKNAIFYETVFLNAIFRRATFQKNAIFRRATFRNADFIETTFRNADFIETTFRNADFEYTTFRENVEFIPKHVEELNLRNTRFLFTGNVAANLTETKFYRANLENVAFADCTWPKKIYEEVHMNGEDLSFKELETIYRNIKQNMQRHGDYSKAGEFYYREMELRRKQYRLFTSKWWGQNILRILCGYGEKPERVIGISLLIIFLGAFLFFFFGVTRVGTELSPEKSPYIIDYSLNSLSFNKATFVDFGYCLYYSVVTFTTLGYGDVHPLGYSHVFASLEAFIGAFFIALFVLVFGRKMLR